MSAAGEVPRQSSCFPFVSAAFPIFILHFIFIFFGQRGGLKESMTYVCFHTYGFSSLSPHPSFVVLFPNVAKFFQILPNFAKFSQILPNSAKICQNLPNSAKNEKG